MSIYRAKRSDGTVLNYADGPFIKDDADDEHPDRLYWLMSEEVFDWAEFAEVYQTVTQQGLRKQPRSVGETIRTWWSKHIPK